MQLYKTFLFILFTSCLISIDLYSQEDVLRPKKIENDMEMYESENLYSNPFSFGIEAGINYNMFSQTLTWEPPVPNSILNVFESANGISPYFALLMDVHIANGFGIQLKAAYEGRSVSNSYTGIADCYDVTTDTYNDAEMKNEFKLNGADIGISLLYRFNLTNELILTAGPMYLTQAGDYEQEWNQTIISEGCFFNMGTPDQSTTRSFVNDVSIDSRIGIDAGVYYRIPIGGTLVLAPQARINYMFSKVRENFQAMDGSRADEFGESLISYEDAMLHALKFGLILWF